MRNSLTIVLLVVLVGLFVGCGDTNIVDGSGSTSFESRLDSTVINLIQWTRENGGNDHYYGVIPLEIYHNEMLDVMDSYEVWPWIAHLATITSAEENLFILNNVVASTHQPSVLDEFWIGAEYVHDEWIWSTGERYDYTNWAEGEPNNIGIETVATMWGPNNTEYNRMPGTWNNALPDDSVNQYSKFWAVVEFEKWSIYFSPSRIIQDSEG